MPRINERKFPAEGRSSLVPLDETARKRVQAALRDALQKELSATPGQPTAVFGEGSIKGRTRQTV